MNSVARACPEGVNFPSIPILASGVMPFPPHQGHALLAFFFCLPNASSTSTLLWYFLQVIFLDPEAKRDIPLLRTPMQFYFKNKIKISHLIFKISPGARYYYYLFFFSTVEYTGTRLKKLTEEPRAVKTWIWNDTQVFWASNPISLSPGHAALSPFLIYPYKASPGTGLVDSHLIS